MVLLSIVVCSLPIPIVWHSKLQPSLPYPCENCPCGCDGPEKCWTTCCCMTPMQRLQWARERGITPPAYAVLELSNATAPATNGAMAKAKSSSCAHCQAKLKKDRSNEMGVKKIRTVLGMAAAKCAGKSFDLSLLPYFTIPSLPTYVVAVVQFCGYCPTAESNWPSRAHDVPVPPPR